MFRFSSTYTRIGAGAPDDAAVATIMNNFTVQSTAFDARQSQEAATHASSRDETMTQIFPDPGDRLEALLSSPSRPLSNDARDKIDAKYQELLLNLNRMIGEQEAMIADQDKLWQQLAKIPDLLDSQTIGSWVDSQKEQFTALYEAQSQIQEKQGGLERKPNPEIENKLKDLEKLIKTIESTNKILKGDTQYQKPRNQIIDAQYLKDLQKLLLLQMQAQYLVVQLEHSRNAYQQNVYASFLDRRDDVFRLQQAQERQQLVAGQQYQIAHIQQNPPQASVVAAVVSGSGALATPVPNVQYSAAAVANIPTKLAECLAGKKPDFSDSTSPAAFKEPIRYPKTSCATLVLFDDVKADATFLIVEKKGDVTVFPVVRKQLLDEKVDLQAKNARVTVEKTSNGSGIKFASGKKGLMQGFGL